MGDGDGVADRLAPADGVPTGPAWSGGTLRVSRLGIAHTATTVATTASSAIPATAAVTGNRLLRAGA